MTENRFRIGFREPMMDKMKPIDHARDQAVGRQHCKRYGYCHECHSKLEHCDCESIMKEVEF